MIPKLLPIKHCLIILAGWMEERLKVEMCPWLVVLEKLRHRVVGY